MAVVRTGSTRRARDPWTWILIIAIAAAATIPLGAPAGVGAVADHLVVSEVVTGGASASDELIEVHNPTAAPLPLEGLELIYVSASGATISRRTSWAAGATSVPPGGHVLVANESGIYAPIADALYASGMAATGGSVALRILGASSAIDAVGWGTTTSSWREGPAAAVVAAGSSLERRPGGAAGSTQDTDDNAVDFVERLVPEPQNLTSPPTPPPGGATPTPAPSGTPAPTSVVTPTPVATPSPTTPIAAARAAPDGTLLTIAGVALTASDFHDGGGYVADGTGGLAVLVTGGAFTRGESLVATGTIDDRFAQRTLRADGEDVVSLGSGEPPAAVAIQTGAIGEAIEGRLIRVGGVIVGGRTELTTGIAFDLDDGTGPIRVLVGTATGIDLSGWEAGVAIELVGVVGQRDSSGSGTAGYRIMPRGPDDILSLATPTPSPTVAPSGTGTPAPSASGPPAGVITISAARALPKNARVTVRGIVTLPSGLVDDTSAAIQDGTGAILLRLGDDAGTLALGAHVQVTGVRSTKSGMETIRVTEAPTGLGASTTPAPMALRTGDATEAIEARLVVARGGLVANARRASSGSISFEVDDGSGPLRVSIPASIGIEHEFLVAGAWIEVTGVLGQETTGSQPLRGYRVWPRTSGDLRIVASTTTATGSASGGGAAEAESAPMGLADLEAASIHGLRVGATLVTGPWPELGIGGLLWDGSGLVAIERGSADRLAAAVGSRPPPLALELSALRQVGTDPTLRVAVVALGRDPGDVVIGPAAPAAPRGSAPAGGVAAWVSLVGSLGGPPSDPTVDFGRAATQLEVRCDADDPLPSGIVAVTGVAIGRPSRILAPCGGVRPAPHLGGALATIPSPRSPFGPIGNPSRATAQHDLRSPLAAALLGLAALAAAAGAVLWRRRQHPDDEGPSAETGDVEPADGADPPRLTLVGVPREHGT